jgi:hypothetical protein
VIYLGLVLLVVGALVAWLVHHPVAARAGAAVAVVGAILAIVGVVLYLTGDSTLGAWGSSWS